MIAKSARVGGPVGFFAVPSLPLAVNEASIWMTTIRRWPQYNHRIKSRAR